MNKDEIERVLKDFMQYLLFSQDLTLCTYEEDTDSFVILGKPWIELVQAYLKVSALLKE